MEKIKRIVSILLGVTFLASSVAIVGIANSRQADVRMMEGATVEPLNAIIATTVVSVIGILIFYFRNKKNKHEREEDYYLQMRIEKGRKEKYRESAF